MHVYSVTKSVVSALFGIALERGMLGGLDRAVLDFFPEYRVKRGEKTIQTVTLRHLLTMTAPYKYKREPYIRFFASPDPVKDALDLLGGKNPPGEFSYTAVGGVQILSAVLQRATGMPLRAFAQENLFGPLGMDVPCDVVFHSKEEQLAAMSSRGTRGWAVDQKGRNTAGWGLFLTPEDMAKFGQLYLDRGAFNGKSLVPEEWVLDSTRGHSCWGERRYGYLWWVIEEKARCFAALGDGGNAIYVNGEKGLAVAVAAAFKPRAQDAVELIRTRIEPLFD